METFLELTERAVPTNVRRIRHRVAEAATEAGASGPVVEEIALCVGEAVANAVLHAYDHDHGLVAVLVRGDDEVVTVVVRDGGRGLGWTRPAADEGFGLRIIEALARDVSISSRPSRGTEVRMHFPVEAPPLHASRASRRRAAA